MRATMQTSCAVHRAPGGRAVASARPAANALPAVRQAAAAAAAAALLLTSTPAFAAPPPLPKDAASAALAEQLEGMARATAEADSAVGRLAGSRAALLREAARIFADDEQVTKWTTKALEKITDPYVEQMFSGMLGNFGGDAL
jgi:hypothetical protein